MDSEDEEDFVPIYEQDSQTDHDEDREQRSDDSQGSSSNRCTTALTARAQATSNLFLDFFVFLCLLWRFEC